MFNFSQLQLESKIWVKHNFGNRPPYQPVIGLSEEYGELLAAQSIADIQDAVADITIFLTDLCNAVNLDMSYLRIDDETFSYSTTVNTLERNMGIFIGKISHHYLKREQGIRGSAAHHENEIAVNVQKLLATLKVYSKLSGFDFMQNIAKVWAQVSKRDWVKERAKVA